MRVAANDHVHIAELGRNDLVGVVAQVRQQHDVANALGLEFVDGFLRGRGFVQELGGGQGREELVILAAGDRPTMPTSTPSTFLIR